METRTVARLKKTRKTIVPSDKPRTKSARATMLMQHELRKMQVNLFRRCKRWVKESLEKVGQEQLAPTQREPLHAEQQAEHMDVGPDQPTIQEESPSNDGMDASGMELGDHQSAGDTTTESLLGSVTLRTPIQPVTIPTIPTAQATVVPATLPMIGNVAAATTLLTPVPLEVPATTPATWTVEQLKEWIIARDRPAPAGESADQRALRTVKLDDYDGRDKMKLATWVWRITQAIEGFDLTVQGRLAIARAHLKGPAELWYMQLDKESKAPTTVEDLLVRMRERFIPTSSEDDARSKLDMLTCRTETGISEYISKFEALRDQIPKVCPAQELWSFKKGLRLLKDLQMNLAMCTDLASAYKIAREREHVAKEYKGGSLDTETRKPIRDKRKGEDQGRHDGHKRGRGKHHGHNDGRQPRDEHRDGQKRQDERPKDQHKGWHNGSNRGHDRGYDRGRGGHHGGQRGGHGQGQRGGGNPNGGHQGGKPHDTK